MHEHSSRRAFRLSSTCCRSFDNLGGDGVFSLKTFVAAMLALYIAFRLDLSQPSWSVTTVYIVSQPFAGDGARPSRCIVCWGR